MFSTPSVGGYNISEKEEIIMSSNDEIAAIEETRAQIEAVNQLADELDPMDALPEEVSQLQEWLDSL